MSLSPRFSSSERQGFTDRVSPSPAGCSIVLQRLGQRRGDPARRHGIDPDALLRPGDRQRLGQLFSEWNGALTGSSMPRFTPLLLETSIARSTADFWPEITT